MKKTKWLHVDRDISFTNQIAGAVFVIFFHLPALFCLLLTGCFLYFVNKK